MDNPVSHCGLVYITRFWVVNLESVVGAVRIGLTKKCIAKLHSLSHKALAVYNLNLYLPEGSRKEYIRSI